MSNKWSVAILFRLREAEVLRFRELQRALGRITQKELTRHLRRLELNDLVSRKVFPVVPPRVEYRLTPLGRALLGPLEGLARFSVELEAARAAKR